MPRGIYIHTKPPWNKGIKGTKHSLITRLKMIKSHTGKKHSEETKKKIGLSNIGNKKFLGKKHTEETKRKLSLIKTGWKMPESGKKKLSEWHKGKPVWNKGYGDYIKGANHPNWKGGITPQNHIIRNSMENKFWKKGNLIQDNYICQKCKIRGGKLRIHHIQNFAQYPELRFDIDNGITFCKKCHDEFHKRYGLKNSTKEQLKDFLKEDKIICGINTMPNLKVDISTI